MYHGDLGWLHGVCGCRFVACGEWTGTSLDQPNFPWNCGTCGLFVVICVKLRCNTRFNRRLAFFAELSEFLITVSASSRQCDSRESDNCALIPVKSVHPLVVDCGCKVQRHETKHSARHLAQWEMPQFAQAETKRRSVRGCGSGYRRTQVRQVTSDNSME